MRTLQKSTLITPVEPIELVAIEYWQDKEDDSSVSKMIQLIPVVAIKINTYEQTYRDSNSVDLITETRYVSPKGEIDIDEFTMIQPIRSDNTLACLSVIALRGKGSAQVCLLEPSGGKNWLNYTSFSINPNLYTTYSSGESHPVLVDLDQLLSDIESTFPAITNFNASNQGSIL
jgi:hypothetical protein